jgi:copper chaperone CopZ
LPGVSSVQVDLVLGAIQLETDSTVSLAAVEVIDNLSRADG